MKRTLLGTIDFANYTRDVSKTNNLPFIDSPKSIRLMNGDYLTKFNENINMSRDLMDEILSKSFLWRYGVLLGARVGESGYRGSLGALL